MTGSGVGTVMEGVASALRSVRARFGLAQTTGIKQVGPFSYHPIEDGKSSYLWDREAALAGLHKNPPKVPNPFETRPAFPATSAYSTPFRCTAVPGAPRWFTYSRMAMLRATAPKVTDAAKDTEEPPSPDVSTPKTPMVPVRLSDKDYHALADEFLNRLLAHLEDLQDNRTDVEVDFADGVINVTIEGVGTYVINKQPHNKQIWLSSPISGPKRYDYMVIGDGMQDKAGTAYSEWIYERDGSTITELFKKELRMNLMMEIGAYR